MNQRVAAVIIKERKILLMHRIKDGREYFVFPGGGVEENESLESALVREIKEEFNIDIKIEKLLFQILLGPRFRERNAVSLLKRFQD